jgi:hypothetical protein
MDKWVHRTCSVELPWVRYRQVPKSFLSLKLFFTHPQYAKDFHLFLLFLFFFYRAFFTSRKYLQKARSRSFYVLISKYITLDGQTLAFNASYRVKYPFFARILALCRARQITFPTIQSASLD